MLTTNFNLVSQNQISIPVKKQEVAQLSSAPQVQTYHSSPSANNLKAYSLPKLSFGFNPKDDEKVMKGNKNLKRADLSDDDLRGVSFKKDTNLKYANLEKAKLQGADLSEVKIYKDEKHWRYAEREKNCSTKLKGAIYNDETLFPRTYTHIDEDSLFRTQKSFNPKNFEMLHQIESEVQSGKPLKDILPKEGRSLENLDLSGADARGTDLSKCKIYKFSDNSIRNSTSLTYVLYDDETKFPKTYIHTNNDGTKEQKPFSPKDFKMETLAEKQERLQKEQKERARLEAESSSSSTDYSGYSNDNDDVPYNDDLGHNGPLGPGGSYGGF